MTLEQFIDLTIDVLQEQDFSEYLPTICIPSKKQLSAIPNIPDDVQHTEALQTIIKRDKLYEFEFLFGTRSGDSEITVGHFCPIAGATFTLIRIFDDAVEIERNVECPWWHIGLNNS